MKQIKNEIINTNLRRNINYTEFIITITHETTYYFGRFPF